MKIIVIAAVAVLLFWLQREIYRKIWNKKLKFELKFEEDTLFVGQQGHLSEKIENAKYVPLPVLKVKFQCARELEFESSENAAVTDLYYRDDIFSVMPMQKTTRRLTFTAKKRGYYTLREADLLAQDFLLSSGYISSYPVDTVLYVYPKAFWSSEFERVLCRLNGQNSAKQYWPEDPFEYRGIRDYQPSDGMSRINWKATAKTEEFKVNEKNAVTLNTVRIYLNLEDSGVLKNEPRVEAAISLAAGAAQYFIRKEYGVAFYCSSKDCITKQVMRLNESTGESHMNIIYRMLARLDTKEAPVNFKEAFKEELKEKGTSYQTIFITVNLYESFIKVLQDYNHTGSIFDCLVPVDEMGVLPVPAGLENILRFIPTEVK